MSLLLVEREAFALLFLAFPLKKYAFIICLFCFFSGCWFRGENENLPMHKKLKLYEDLFANDVDLRLKEHEAEGIRHHLSIQPKF